jgi:hypothetical protein
MTDGVAFGWVVALAVGLGAGLWWARSQPGFGVTLLNRWLRWLLLGFGLALFLRTMEWAGRPYWALVPAFVLAAILVESVYAWLAVRALSLSRIPVYPEYRRTEEASFWPVSRYYLRRKKEIEALGFVRREALEADLQDEIRLRSLLYTDAEGTTRLQLLFVPRAGGRPALFAIFTTHGEEKTLLTDNVWLPLGGALPPHWILRRRPFVGSLRRLHALHAREVRRRGLQPQGGEEDLVEELNDEQDYLDEVSTEQGLLFPRSQRAEHGKLTGPGRYRIWKQMLLLHLFGKVGHG